MIPDGRNTPNRDPPDHSPPAHVPAQPLTVVPPGSSTAIHAQFAMTPLSDVPLRPSTAPPHPTTDATKGKEPQTEQTQTMLVSNLRARNLLLQKAISHIDDAVLHLMAARSGIPNSKIQQVRGEARNRKDLLDRVDRAIKMAQTGELQEGRDTGEGTSSVTGNERLFAESRPTHVLQPEAHSGTTLPAPPNVVHLSSASEDAPQLRRSSSQPQLGPSTGDRQVPVKMYTLPELIERRKILQESIRSWQNFIAELSDAQPHLEAHTQSMPPDAVPAQPSTATAVSSSEPNESSWTAKYQRAQFEIKRREDLLLRLNLAIAQASQSAHTPTPEQITALATFMPPALDKARFDVAYTRFCKEKSIQAITSIVMPDVSRPVIDVYSLHVAVMDEGSFARVSARKSWDVVGGRLGFTQTAATATEPARSSPEIAAHLEKAYRDRLQQFDHLYVSSVIETVRKRMAEQQRKP